MEQNIKIHKMKTISIIGKTNTGKSTLFNLLLKKKESIISEKKNTTIRCIEEKVKEVIIIDTPGIILNYKDKNKKINTLIYDAIKNSNLIIINIEEKNLESEDFFLLELIKKKEKFLTLNKIDKLKSKKEILMTINNLSKYSTFIEIIPTSNKKKQNTDTINKVITNFKPKTNITNYIYKKDKIKFKIIDIIRETLLEKFQKEIPYITKIELHNFSENNDVLDINIIIKKQSHKKIIIGKEGKNLLNIRQLIKKKINNRAELKISKINLNIKYDNKHWN